MQACPSTIGSSQAEGVVYAPSDGVISLDDITRYRDRLRADADFSPEMHSHADLGDVTVFEPTSTDMASIVRDDPFGPDSLHAAVARADIVFGMLRMYDFRVHRTASQSRVFREMADARRWLDLKAEGRGS